MERDKHVVANGGPTRAGGQDRTPHGGFAGFRGSDEAQHLGHSNFLNSGETFI